MLLAFPNGQAFATGSSTYENKPASEADQTNRIYVRASMEGFETSAILDTAAPYVVCAPPVSQVVQFGPTAALEQTRLLIRGIRFKGTLHRLTLVFPAEKGEPLTLEATGFVPDETETNPIPSFIGLAGCLERMRFAVDPAEDTFYFGALSQD